MKPVVQSGPEYQRTIGIDSAFCVGCAEIEIFAPNRYVPGAAATHWSTAGTNGGLAPGAINSSRAEPEPGAPVASAVGSKTVPGYTFQPLRLPANDGFVRRLTALA